MNTNVTRALLLALLFICIAICMTIPFLSEETLVPLDAAFQSLCYTFFFLSLGLLAYFSIGPNCIELWKVRRSRNECRKAHRALYRYFNEYPLEGFETTECRRLHRNLQSELKRHCSQYPFERHHETVKGYAHYCRRIVATRSVV